ncbi:hypothetical protein HN873_055743 [Arachis hypogaea]
MGGAISGHVVNGVPAPSKYHSIRQILQMDSSYKMEQETKMLEQVSEMKLTQETKKLRRACFKVNYKRRKFLASKSYSSSLS